VEGYGKSGLALLEKVVVAAIGFFGRGESRELPHRPKLAAVHVAVNAASVRKFARRAQIEARDIVRTIQRLDGDAADCRKLAFGGFHRPATVLILTLMLKSTIFREYDIRGVADAELLDPDVQQLGRAFGTYLQRNAGKHVVLGRDTRLSSPRLHD